MVALEARARAVPKGDARLAEDHCKMTTEHIKTRTKIKEIASISSFNELLTASTLSDEDKEILRLHYLKDKDFRYIGDMFGYSESTIKKRHKKAIAKLSKLL